jgi:hypothetical protein
VRLVARKPSVPQIGDWLKRAGDGSGGSVTGERCPECGGHIVYNGSYFCENWTWDCVRQGATEKPDYERTCDWGLPSDTQITYLERVLSYRLTRVWYTENKHGDRVYAHHTFPGKVGYVRVKYRKYLENLGPIGDRVWWKIRDERQQKGLIKTW